MKNQTLLSGLCKLAALFLFISGAAVLLNEAANILMYWNLRARPYGSLWSLSLIAGPLFEVIAASLLFFKSQFIARRLAPTPDFNCPRCGYDCRANPTSICPECGHSDFDFDRESQTFPRHNPPAKSQRNHRPRFSLEA